MASYTIPGYKIIRLLGEGGYGVVYEVVNEKGTRFAAKVTKFEDTMLAEVDLMMRIDHPHIVHGVDVVTDKDTVYLIEELGDVITDKLESLAETDKIRIIFELGSALQFLQENNLAHCDLTLSNILLINGRAQLADLGIVVYTHVQHKLCEKELYRAPEYVIDVVGKGGRMFMFNQLKPEIKERVGAENLTKRNIYQAEIWSFGIMCLEILYNIPGMPYGSSNVYWHRLLASENPKQYIIERIGYPNNRNLFDLIMDKLIQFDLNKRLKTFREFISDDLFTRNGHICCPLPMGDIPNSYKQKNIIPEEERELFTKVNYDIMTVCANMALENIIAFLSLDLFRHKWVYYAVPHNENEIYLFGAACIYLANKVINQPDIINSLSVINSELSSRGITSKKIIAFSYRIFTDENGILGKKTMYDYATSVELLIKATDNIMETVYHESDTEEYAIYILSLETAKDANKKTLKNSVTFSYVF